MPSKAFICLITASLLISCGGKESTLDDYSVTLYSPAYADGFEIKTAPGAESSLIVCRTPWQGAGDDDASMLFLARGGEKAPEGFKGQVLDGGEAKRIVCMSSSYIAMLNAIGQIDRVGAVSGRDFISNPIIAQRNLPDIGYDNNLDYETLVAINPDLVLLYGVTGSNAMESKLRELGIPYVYMGEYLEEHPLGKAEWLVAIGELTGLRDEAIDRFDSIEPAYYALSAMADSLDNKPRVMLNTPYADSWVMAPPSSYMGRLIKDAGGEYVYSQSQSNTSMPIDLEEAYILADGADYWLNVGQYDSMADLKAALPKFSDTKPVRTGNVWNCSLRATPGGGNDYWESGVVNPHLALADLIKIFHPGSLDSIPFTYYRRLE